MWCVFKQVSLLRPIRLVHLRHSVPATEAEVWAYDNHGSRLVLAENVMLEFLSFLNVLYICIYAKCA